MVLTCVVEAVLILSQDRAPFNAIFLVLGSAKTLPRKLYHSVLLQSQLFPGLL